MAKHVLYMQTTRNFPNHLYRNPFPPIGIVIAAMKGVHIRRLSNFMPGPMEQEIKNFQVNLKLNYVLVN